MSVAARRDVIGVTCAALGVAVLTATVAVAGHRPGYSPAADTVSRLGSPGQPRALAVRTAMVAYGLLVLAAAAPLRRLVERGGGMLVVLVGVYAVAAVLAGLAPKDAAAAPVTAAGRLHVAATVLGGAALIGAMVLVARHGRWPVDRIAAGIVGTVSLVLAIAFGAMWGSPLYGAIERVLISVAAGWVAMLPLRAFYAFRPPGEAPILTGSQPRSKEVHDRV
jgi:hypothetical membrane protein